MDFWKKRKKKPEDPFEEINRMMNEFMKNLMDSDFSKLFDEELFEKLEPGKPAVYGFSIKVGPEGKLKIDKFGNIEPKEEEIEIRDEREPLVDVIEKDKEITILAELPGVSKKDIDIHVTKDKEHLVIRVPGKFYKKLKLPAKVFSKLGKAHYKNGVLEVNLKKKQSRGRIKVE